MVAPPTTSVSNGLSLIRGGSSYAESIWEAGFGASSPAPVACRSAFPSAPRFKGISGNHLLQIACGQSAGHQFQKGSGSCRDRLPCWPNSVNWHGQRLEIGKQQFDLPFIEQTADLPKWCDSDAKSKGDRFVARRCGVGSKSAPNGDRLFAIRDPERPNAGVLSRPANDAIMVSKFGRCTRPPVPGQVGWRSKRDTTQRP
jgi:hypothetical protein